MLVELTSAHDGILEERVAHPTMLAILCDDKHVVQDPCWSQQVGDLQASGTVCENWYDCFPILDAYEGAMKHY